MTSPRRHTSELPEHLRSPALVLIALAVVVFAAGAAAYAGSTGDGALDLRTETLVDAAARPHEQLFHVLTAFGSPPAVVAGALGSAAVCLVLRRRRLAVVAVVGPGLTGLATTLLKPAIGRTTEFGGFAYPSGHTGGATAVALVVALLVVSLWRPGRTTGTALIVTLALIAGSSVGVALVATDAHYPTDTVGGFCAAVALVLGSALGLEWAAARWRRGVHDHGLRALTVVRAALSARKS